MLLLPQLTRKRHDMVSVIFGILLLVSPVWVTALGVGEPRYQYDRVQVLIDDEDGLTYASDDPAKFVPISTNIGCSIPQDVRTCAFERYLLANHTIPTTVYTNNPDLETAPYDMARYQYVMVNGSAYRPVQVPNKSVQRDDGIYRVDLDLESVSIESALRNAALNASLERDQIPNPVYQAAVSGESSSTNEVDVPTTPIRLENGEYYRVYVDGQTEAPGILQILRWVLTYIGPLLGAGILIRVFQRIEITYIGNEP